MKRFFCLVGALVVLSSSLPSSLAVGMNDVLEQQSALEVRIQQVLLQDVKQALDALQDEHPVPALLYLCWQTDASFQVAEPDPEAFKGKYAYATTMFLASDAWQAAVLQHERQLEEAHLQEQARQQAIAQGKLDQEALAQQYALDYARADLLQKAGLVDEAYALFVSLGNYQDSADRAAQCLIIQNSTAYNKAAEAEAQGRLLAAYEGFLALGGFQDAQARAQSSLHSFIKTKAEDAVKAYEAKPVNYSHYNELINTINQLTSPSQETAQTIGEAYFQLGLAALHAEVYEDAKDLFSYLARNSWPGVQEHLNAVQEKIDALQRAELEQAEQVIRVTGGTYPFFIHRNGRVSGPAAEVYPQSSQWKNVVDAGTNLLYAAALHSDGTVSIAPNPFFYQKKGLYAIPLPDTSKWRNIKSLSVGPNHLLAVDKAGRIQKEGDNRYGQLDYQANAKTQGFASGIYHSLQIRDQQITALGNNLFQQTAIRENATANAIAAGAFHSLLLTERGRVLASGMNLDGQGEVQEWEGITAIAAGAYHSVGLKADGTVVATGLDDQGQTQVGDWAGVISIAAGPGYTIGLQADGTVLSTVAAGHYLPYADSAWLKAAPEALLGETIEASVNLWIPVDIEAGQTIEFGYYEQDGDKENGEEPITWLVLAVENDKVLLISQHSLDEQQYHNQQGSITWAESSLRDWLNKEFLENAFSNQEQTFLLSTELNNDSPFSKGNGGMATQDQVFLLSQAETKLYFKSISDRVAITVPAVIPATKDGSLSKSSWWLRSTVNNDILAAYISSTGYINTYGSAQTRLGIRPAIWVSR